MSGLISTEARIPKTTKLFVGGEFPRTESGRSYPLFVQGTQQVYSHLCQGSKKDFRNAVEKARSALGDWSGRSAMNRSQILYRVAEMLETKRDELREILTLIEALSTSEVTRSLDYAIDAWVYYAGFSDKIASLLGSLNPVASPHQNITSIEPMGVVTYLASKDAPLGTVCSHLAAILCSGNTVVAILPEKKGAWIAPLGEALATSDLPKGTVNLLSGYEEELLEVIGSHREVNAVCYAGSKLDHLTQLKTLGVENMKRVHIPALRDRSIDQILPFLEYKTTWHPVGW